MRWRSSTHDQIYDDEYFRYVDKTTLESAKMIADSIIESFHPATVIDVGCGTGALLDCFRSRGVHGKGLEYASAAVQFCRTRKLDVVQADLAAGPLPPLGRADVAISMEVGHQLPKKAADLYVDLLCQAADVVVFSSETPGGGDKYPLNEQPHGYWINKFTLRGFIHDEPLSLSWRRNWQEANIASWFIRNVMVFRRVS